MLKGLKESLTGDEIDLKSVEMRLSAFRKHTAKYGEKWRIYLNCASSFIFFLIFNDLEFFYGDEINNNNKNRTKTEDVLTSKQSKNLAIRYEECSLSRLLFR